jgi:DNA repair exonuclease SbcCD ATPase subunit
MKLHLRNFRCYEDRVFDFGDSGVTLLSGASGAGKSTIMIAIQFVLFGIGTKLPTHGKKSCSVELTLPDIKIIRSKGPVRLVVNDVYEDDAGEAIIREKFGNMFSSVSYIPQDLRDSFIVMSPANKLEFLEKFAFGDVDIREIKGRVKSLVRSLADEHTRITGNLEFASKLLSETQKPTVVPFPIKCKKELYEKAIRNTEIKHKNAVTLIKRTEKEIQALEMEKSDTAIFEALTREKRDVMSELQAKVTTLQATAIPYIGDQELEVLKARLQRFLNNRAVETLRTQYRENTEKVEELKALELLDMQKRLDQYLPTLWDGIPKDEIGDEIEGIKALITTAKTLDRLKGERTKIKLDVDPTTALREASATLEGLKKTLERVKLQKEVLSCPHCSNSVRFLNGSLVKSEIPTEDEPLEDVMEKIKQTSKKETELREKLARYNRDKDKMEKLTREIETIETENDGLDNVDVLESELQDAERYRDDNKTLNEKVEELRKNIRDRVFSRTISSLEKKNNSLKTELEALEKGAGIVDESIDEEELRATIARETENCNQIRRVGKQITDYTGELDKVSRAITRLETDHRAKWSGNTQPFDQAIVEKRELITSHEATRDDQADILTKIAKYLEAEKEMENYRKLERKTEESKVAEIRARKRYGSACLFRDKILETESIAIANMIESINAHAQLYLDHFFPDNPISVKLQSFRESKTGDKPCINLEIDYRGIEHDLSMLSGGELSRVILAFTLALAEIHNSPLILLDESTASLDQDLTSSVITGLKENFSSRLVILIAHQVVQGVFDKVIKL